MPAEITGPRDRGCSTDPERLLEDARKRLAEAKTESTSGLLQEVDTAEIALVRLRDCLIERVRKGQGGPDAGREREALGKVNVALTLLIGLEYPLSGVHRKMLDEAGGLLEQLTIGRNAGP